MPTLATANFANLQLLDRPDLALTLTKINLWRLTQFRKCVYLDADVLALRAPDELFDLDVDFAVLSLVAYANVRRLQTLDGPISSTL
jgi:alpha-N-acetylglucosamine transferase